MIKISSLTVTFMYRNRCSAQLLQESALVTALSRKPTLIGLRYRESIASYLWSDGTTLDYTSWQSVKHKF